MALIPDALCFACPHFMILFKHSPWKTRWETLSVLPGTHSRTCPSVLAGGGKRPSLQEEVTKSGLLPLAFTLHKSLVKPEQL